MIGDDNDTIMLVIIYNNIAGDITTYNDYLSKVFQSLRLSECKARVDLAFLLDGSNHVGRDHFDRSVEFVKKIIKSFTVSHDQAHVSVAVCSETPHILFDLKAFDDHKGLDKAMKSISYPKGMLFTGI